MNNTIKFLVNDNDSGKRLDIFLSEKINHLTRSYIKKMISLDKVRINKKLTTFPSQKIKSNDSIIINLIVQDEKKLL